MGAAKGECGMTRSRRSRAVYFIKPVGMDGPIKIGCSQSPDSRREALDTWAPFALEIIAEIEGSLVLERRFHARHWDAHERKEWFTATDALKADIAAIKAGTFNVADLPEPKKLPSKRGWRTGRKWTEEQKADVRRRNAIRRAETSTGLVCPWNFNDERVADFINEPKVHGITREEQRELWDAQYRQRRLATLEKELAQLKAAA